MGAIPPYSDKFRRDLIDYFADNKDFIRPPIVIEKEDHMIIFKQDAKANTYDMVVPVSYMLTGGVRLLDATLKNDLKVDIKVGALVVGTVYPKGTPLETLWIDMLTFTGVRNLTFDTWKSVVEVGTTVRPQVLRWTETGTVGEKTISDNEGNKIVTNTVGSAGWLTEYTKNIPDSIKWTLNPEFTSAISLKTMWIYPSYYGKSLTPIDKDNLPVIDLDDPTRMIVDASTNITVDLQTTNREYGWIAVPNGSTPYDWWKVTELNQGNIGLPSSGISSFIKYIGFFSVHGIHYDFYVYSYPSELTEPLTLYKR